MDVDPYPRPRAEIDGSLSRIENVIPCLLSPWPNMSPLMPALMNRTLLWASAGLAGDVSLNGDIGRPSEVLSVYKEVLQAACTLSNQAIAWMLGKV